MTKEQFVEVIKELFLEDAAGITMDTAFRELEEWSSMQALIVIAAIDEHFGVTLPEKEFRGAITFSDLFHLTLSNLKK